ncbi:HSP20 family protein [Caulobacter ginsengisoli]|uniref:HSP20 family protein n=1 Tax=Caulobacter ginsengisoli TaxID=400775 RepID=A0ABU0J187_9CAUL|nr:Hsp20/alpha crystallin family protein [Caulobacter ginsengisoli]MDQ0466982.1 HSP20 family protein [Caulobacter ginsengisoli]
MTSQPPAKQFTANVQRSATDVFGPIQREFNRLFDQLGSGWTAFTELDLIPRLDMRETEDAIEVTMELPGISEQDVKIAIEDDVLTISGEKKSESESKKGDVRVSERTYGAFSRSISLPRGVDAEKIKASMAKGVLTITAPRDGAAAAKTIPIVAAK